MRTAEAIWNVARQLRGVVARENSAWALRADALIAAASSLEICRRTIVADWDVTHAVHDEAGHPVLGICETDPAAPGMALVSVNAAMVANQPELALSTAAHEVGHIVFDVPSATELPARRYRSVTAGPNCLDRAIMLSERRANEFMGAVLVPPASLHLRLIPFTHVPRSCRWFMRRTRDERAAGTLGPRTQSDALAGIIAALAGDFGVSDRFISVPTAAVRLD